MSWSHHCEVESPDPGSESFRGGDPSPWSSLTRHGGVCRLKVGVSPGKDSNRESKETKDSVSPTIEEEDTMESQEKNGKVTYCWNMDHDHKIYFKETSSLTTPKIDNTTIYFINTKNITYVII